MNWLTPVEPFRRTLLAAGDPQPLPETVEALLAAAEQRGAACTCKGTALLIECISQQIAEMVAQNSHVLVNPASAGSGRCS